MPLHRQDIWIAEARKHYHEKRKDKEKGKNHPLREILSNCQNLEQVFNEVENYYGDRLGNGVPLLRAFFEHHQAQFPFRIITSPDELEAITKEFPATEAIENYMYPRGINDSILYLMLPYRPDGGAPMVAHRATNSCDAYQQDWKYYHRGCEFTCFWAFAGFDTQNAVGLSSWFNKCPRTI